jgi:AraC-like DNA-binding protein
VWQANPKVREVFREIGGCVEKWEDPRAASRLAVAVNRLLVEVLDLLGEERADELPSRAMRRRTVELFLRDLAENPLGSAEPWTLGGMAARCGMGVTAMSAYCRELVNNGPMTYLNLCRLEHAARLLVELPGESVTSIAMRTGFNSSQYFATQFRKRYHLTPGQYRVRN